MGEEDTNPNHHALNTTAPAQEQGQHRFERGHTFYATVQQAAAALGVELRWPLRIVPGAGHDNSAMAASAVQWLFQ